MKREREKMTVRVVSLHSDDAGDGRVECTAAQRLAIVADLSRRMWALTGRAGSAYTRDDTGEADTLGEQ